MLSQDKSGREQDGKEENENEEQPEGELYNLNVSLRVRAGRQPNFQGHLSDIIFVYVHILRRHTPTFIVKQ